MTSSRPPGLKWVCRNPECDLRGWYQKGDHESVYFAILCVECAGPVEAVKHEQEVSDV